MIDKASIFCYNLNVTRKRNLTNLTRKEKENGYFADYQRQWQCVQAHEMVQPAQERRMQSSV